MRKNLLTILCSLVLSVGFTNKSNAQSTLIYFWDFNNFSSSITFTPATPAASLAADYAVAPLDTAKARWIDAPTALSVLTSPTTRYCDDVTPAAGSPDFDTVNERTIAGSLVPSGNAFRARNPDDSLQILMYMPTTGYKNLQIKYGCETSSYTSGDSVNVFSYSLDSGATWISSGTGLSEWVDSGSVSFRLVSVHVNDTLANNNKKFVFAIHFVGRNTGGSGNNRFDNVSLDGNPITSLETNSVAGPAPKYSLYPNPVASTINVNSNLVGNKTVTVTDMIGKAVISESKTGSDFSLNTAALVSGVYYITVRENESGNTTTLKFVKQ